MAKVVMELLEELHEGKLNADEEKKDKDKLVEEFAAKKIADDTFVESGPDDRLVKSVSVKNNFAEDNYSGSKVSENGIEKDKTEEDQSDQDGNQTFRNQFVKDEAGKERISKKDKQGFKSIIEKDSIQFNSQDLGQEQNVDLKPIQVNSPNIHIHVNDDKNYSAKITGTTYLERNRYILKNVKIYLYFGYESRFPVYETNSDYNGNYAIEDIPPGYYILIARYDVYEYRSHYIKVRPCQSIHHSILLK